MNDLVQSEIRVFREARSIIAESLWWGSKGAMHWCDIDAGTLHRSVVGDPVDGSRDTVIALSPPVSAFQPAGDGFVVSGQSSIDIVDARGNLIRTLARIPHRSQNIRFNEGKCDPAGRFVVGSMDLRGEFDGAIYSIDASGEWRTLLGGIGVANGFEWSDDGRRMWFTDTALSTIFVADYSPEGEISQVAPFIRGHTSDGLVRDVDGGFWNGINETGQVVRWNEDGHQDLEIDVPAGHVTSVAFGGVDLSTLFIATAREKLTEDELLKLPLSGSIFCIDTTTHGLPTRSFGPGGRRNSDPEGK